MSPSKKFTHKRNLATCVGFGILFSVLLFSGTLHSSKRQSGALRILFVGNSYTFYNNLPEIFRVLAIDAGKPAPQVEMYAVGGATLQDHWNDEKLRAKVREGKWDRVVLQEGSGLGGTFFVEGEIRILRGDYFTKAARLWHAEIAKTGAKTILFEAWPRVDAPEPDRAMLRYAYVTTARDLKAELAPIGSAWAEARRRSAELKLYDEDGSHPSSAGSYLAACTLFSVIYGRSCQGLPGKVEGPPVNLETEKIETEKRAVLADLSKEQVKIVQRVSWQQVKNAKNKSGTRPANPPSIRVPTLPTGQSFKPEELVGTWKGENRVYPQFLPWPAKMELRVSPDTNGWKANLRVSFGGKPDDILAENSLKIMDSSFVFVDPKGPNGGIVRYQGVLREGTLTGIAEILVEGKPIYGIGSWQLQRVQ